MLQSIFSERKKRKNKKNAYTQTQNMLPVISRDLYVSSMLPRLRVTVTSRTMTTVSFPLLKKYLFVWLCWVFAAACQRFLEAAASGALSSCGVQVSLCSGALVAKHGTWGAHFQYPPAPGLVAVACGPGAPAQQSGA